MLPSRVVLPVRVGLDPMERLLVATFRSDPEFEGIEPQVFDDAVNGKGMRVLHYRRDGRVDVYWQRGVHVDRSTFVLGAGIADCAEVIVDPARFEIAGRGAAPGRVEVVFLPSCPSLTNLPVGGCTSGCWSMRNMEISITGGAYRLVRQGPRVAVESDVLQHWRPSGLPVSMKVFTQLMRTFRTWPSSCRWRGRVDLAESPTMSGAWERTGRR